MYLVNIKEKSYYETNKLELAEWVGVGLDEFLADFCSMLEIVKADKVNRHLPGGVRFAFSESTILNRYPSFENVTQFL